LTRAERIAANQTCQSDAWGLCRLNSPPLAHRKSLLLKPQICPERGWRLGGVVPFGVVACVQEVAVTPGELLADADLIHYTMGAPWT
jgi:hypothetical protein